MGLLQQKIGARLLYWIMCLLAAGAIILMLYALIWEAGNIVNLPNKRIGFYNFCLWNQTTGELQCLEFKDLIEMGIGQVGMVLTRVSVYFVQVLCLFSPFFIMQAKCVNTREAWEVNLVVQGISVVLLSGGLSLFLFQTRVWIQCSELSWGFLALVGAQALLLLQLFAAAAYLKWFKPGPSKGSPPPEKQLPPLKV
ncbi:transmembrane protein 140 [Emydura macquarii macquarii]|uniref:transmembrane protein 140 n=1 Tax=Emydura macquarii macquarii TaxID=1129001 RepID=UPI00352B51BA